MAWLVIWLAQHTILVGLAIIFPCLGGILAVPEFWLRQAGPDANLASQTAFLLAQRNLADQDESWLARVLFWLAQARYSDVPGRKSVWS